MSYKPLSDWRRIRLVGTVACRLCALLVCLGITVSEDLWAREAQRVRFDAIVDREVQTVSNLQWYDSRRLLGQFDDRRSQNAAIRTISGNGELSNPLQNGSYPSVSPDGQFLIAFTGSRWAVRDISRAVVTYIDDPVDDPGTCQPRQRPVWSHDGRYVALIQCYGRVTPEERRALKRGSGVRVMDVADRGAPLEPESQIVIYDRTKADGRQRILLDEFSLEMAWGPHGMLYVSTSGLISGDASTKLLRMQPGSSAATEIYNTPGRFQDMFPAVHPDGEIIALVLDADHRVWDDFQSLILIDARTGRELRRLTDNLPLVGADYGWSPTGGEVYARVRHGGLDQIYAIPLHGEPRQLTHGKRRHYAMQLSPDGRRLAYQTEDGYGRTDIRILDLETAEEETLLMVDEPADEFDLGLWQHIRWDSTDGVRPFGYLFLPPDFDASKRYPMLVDVHGGGQGSRLYLKAPFSISVAPGPLEWHAWAATGFVVFVPDYRSTGDYGPETIGARYRSGALAAAQDIEDIVSGTRFIIRQGFVDPAKIAILGHSAGGQRVFLLLTKHSLYSAAVVNEAIAPDPVSLVIGKLTGDNTGSYPDGVFRQLFGGELDEYPDRYKANHIFDSYRITTPTLMMVGNADLGGVSHMPIEVIYSILRHYGTPVKMLEFLDDGHTYSHPEAAKYAFAEARRWIKTHSGAE